MRWIMPKSARVAASSGPTGWMRGAAEYIDRADSISGGGVSSGSGELVQITRRRQTVLLIRCLLYGSSQPLASPKKYLDMYSQYARRIPEATSRSVLRRLGG